MTDNKAIDNNLITNREAKNKKAIGKIIIHLVLIFYGFIILFPFLIIVATSFKTWQEASDLGFSFFPKEGFVLEGYREAFSYGDGAMLWSFIRTLFYVIPPTLVGLMASSIAAYAFAKLRFRAKNAMYATLLFTMMIPGTITIASQYSIYDAIGWVDTPLPLMIPGMFGAAACVFFMRQFYSGIPDSIIEAAKLDGVGFVGIFFKIMVPLSVPALLAQGLLGFIGGYNDYFNPLIYLQSSDLYTLQITLRVYATVYVNKPNVVMAGTLVALVPTLLIYLVAQKYFIEGIASTGIKQ